jgi:hypothetical protein
LTKKSILPNGENTNVATKVAPVVISKVIVNKIGKNCDKLV